MPVLAEQKLRVAKFFENNKWKLLSDDNFGPGEDFRIIKRKMENVPWENLDGALQYLADEPSFVSPVVEGKTYTGTWYQGHVWWEKSARADESVITLYQLLVSGEGGSWVLTTPCRGGPIVTTICHDMTKAASDALLAELLNTNNNSSGWSRDRETNRWSGSITTRNVLAEGDAEFFDLGWFDELDVDFRWDHGGRLIKEVWKITCCYKLSAPQRQGLVYYHQGGNNPTLGTGVAPSNAEKIGPPLSRWSFFSRLGNDKYYFKRTVKAQLLTKNMTQGYEYDNRGTMANFVSNTGATYP